MTLPRYKQTLKAVLETLKDVKTPLTTKQLQGRLPTPVNLRTLRRKVRQIEAASAIQTKKVAGQAKGVQVQITSVDQERIDQELQAHGLTTEQDIPIQKVV